MPKKNNREMFCTGMISIKSKRHYEGTLSEYEMLYKCGLCGYYHIYNKVTTKIKRTEEDNAR